MPSHGHVLATIHVTETMQCSPLLARYRAGVLMKISTVLYCTVLFTPEKMKAKTQQGDDIGTLRIVRTSNNNLSAGAKC